MPIKRDTVGKGTTELPLREDTVGYEGDKWEVRANSEPTRSKQRGWWPYVYKFVALSACVWCEGDELSLSLTGPGLGSDQVCYITTLMIVSALCWWCVSVSRPHVTVINFRIWCFCFITGTVITAAGVAALSSLLLV